MNLGQELSNSQKAGHDNYIVIPGASELLLHLDMENNPWPKGVLINDRINTERILRSNLSFKKFTEILNVNEWVASNETETFTYFRIPDMRGHSLDYTIMYDLLLHAGYNQPQIDDLLMLRKNIINGADYPELSEHPDASMVFSYLRKYKENNAIWCKLWYDNFPEIPAAYADERMCLPVLEYDKILKHYIPGVHFENQQLAYEKNILQNIRTLGLLAQLPESDIPKTFADCEKTLKKLDGIVIIPEVAEHFHFTYIKNKKVGTPKQNK